VKGGRYGPTFHEAGGRGGRTIGTKRTLLVEILRVAARRSRGLRSTPRRRRRPRAPARSPRRSPERPGDRRRPGLPGPRGARRAQAPRARHQGAATGRQRLRPDPAALSDRARVRRSWGVGVGCRAATRAPPRAPGPGSRSPASATSPGARSPDRGGPTSPGSRSPLARPIRVRPFEGSLHPSTRAPLADADVRARRQPPTPRPPDQQGGDFGYRCPRAATRSRRREKSVRRLSPPNLFSRQALSLASSGSAAPATPTEGRSGWSDLRSSGRSPG